MYRVMRPDGNLTDMVNLTRARGTSLSAVTATARFNIQLLQKA
jgi:hypothetical protein